MAEDAGPKESDVGIPWVEEAPQPGLDASAATTSSLDGRAAGRAPHPLWRLGKALLILVLMAGAAWGLYEGLVYVAGPSLASSTPGYKLDEYSAEAYDRQGVADILFTGVQPLPEAEGEGVLITWTAHNTGAKTWFPSTHHWEPIYPDLPPLSLPRLIKPYDAVKMAVRLPGGAGPLVGWRLVGLEGPVQHGQIEVSISRADERK